MPALQREQILLFASVSASWMKAISSFGNAAGGQPRAHVLVNVEAPGVRAPHHGLCVRVLAGGSLPLSQSRGLTNTTTSGEFTNVLVNFFGLNLVYAL